ncbi:MAG TPA: hypothetical protein VGL56_17455 [Fimbriimonadaceae bacterium]|jgi:hypothetical protein
MADEDITPPSRRREVTGDDLEINPTPEPNISYGGTPRRTTVRKTTKPRAKSSKTKKVVAEPAIVSAAAASLPPSGPPPESGGEAVAESLIAREVIRARLNLRYTQIAGTTITLIGAVTLLFITNGFASNLQPGTAATITQGIISDHLDDYIPQIQQQIREEVPAEIAKVPDYAKEQLPKYRQTLEIQLEKAMQSYAIKTAPQLGQQVDMFLANNKDAVREMVQSGGSGQDVADLGQNMKQMFVDYLNTTTINGETLKSKVNTTLADLTSIDARVARMAANKNLTDNEKRGRRAIAILLRSVDENPQLQEASQALQSIDTTPITGALQWKSQDEAVFTAPGKAPMAFIRKKDSPLQAAPKIKKAPVLTPSGKNPGAAKKL